MMDQLIAIKDKILAFWNKYTSRQKTIIICVVLAIFFALVLLGYFLTRPTYLDLVTLKGDTAAEFDDALTEAGISYKKEADSDGRTHFRVEQSQHADAVLLMGSNNIVDDEMTWEDALDNDISTSSTEKQTKAVLAMQSSIRKGLMNFDGVEDATVYINRPVDDGTIYAERKDTSVSAALKLEEGAEMDSEAAKAIAYYLANAVGNTSTDEIILTDTAGNLLYGAKQDNTRTSATCCLRRGTTTCRSEAPTSNSTWTR